jgi:hypothetical protein
VDALLIEGLERYFDGKFEDAIHLWTRVLFLDRHQASARAYIERARGAIAERQRRSDEAVQVVAALLDAGHAVEARARLAQVIATTGDDDRTAALRLRLERLERVAGGVSRIHAAPVPVTPWWQHGIALANYRIRRREAVTVGLLVCVLAVALSPALRTRLGFQTARETPLVAPTPLAMPVLSRGEVALIRARALYARGRLAEALAVLDRVGGEQVERPDADSLRVEIQRVLLAAAGTR